MPNSDLIYVTLHGIPLSFKLEFPFQNPNDDEPFGYLKRSIYWRAKLGQKTIELADPVEELYLSRTGDQIFEAAKKLVTEKLITLSGSQATATPALMAESAHI